jgi:hypothetical protein
MNMTAIAPARGTNKVASSADTPIYQLIRL